MLPLVFLALAATSRILPSLEQETPEFEPGELAEAPEFEPGEPGEPPEFELGELGSMCSCAVRCCRFANEPRRPSIYFHMPQVIGMQCCGCVDCPAILYNPQSQIPMMTNTPSQQQTMTPVGFPQMSGEVEPPEVEVIGHDHFGAPIIETEPGEVEPAEGRR